MVFRYLSQCNSEIRRLFAGGKDLPDFFKLDPQSNGVWMIFPLEMAFSYRFI
jgi:hypothetical protein